MEVKATRIAVEISGEEAMNLARFVEFSLLRLASENVGKTWEQMQGVNPSMTDTFRITYCVLCAMGEQAYADGIEARVETVLGTRGQSKTH